MEGWSPQFLPTTIQKILRTPVWYHYTYIHHTQQRNYHVNFVVAISRNLLVNQFRMGLRSEGGTWKLYPIWYDREFHWFNCRSTVLNCWHLYVRQSFQSTCCSISSNPNQEGPTEIFFPSKTPCIEFWNYITNQQKNFWATSSGCYSVFNISKRLKYYHKISW